MKVKGWLCGAGSPLQPLYDIWGSNSGWEACFFTRLSHFTGPPLTFVEAGSLSEPGDPWCHCIRWPSSHRDPPASPSLTPGLQACAALPGLFQMGPEKQAHIIMLAHATHHAWPSNTSPMEPSPAITQDANILKFWGHLNMLIHACPLSLQLPLP